jgi:hypothetical protein
MRELCPEARPDTMEDAARRETGRFEWNFNPWWAGRRIPDAS